MLPDEYCQNCGHKIGRADTPMVWNDAVVCGGCHVQLQAVEDLTKMAPPPPANRSEFRWFHSKVAGVSHDNDDGTSRQQLIARCQCPEQLALTDSRNPEFPEGVEVHRRHDGGQIGWLPEDVAEGILPMAADGYLFLAFICNLTGGTVDKPTRGVNLLIFVFPPGASEDDIRDYIDAYQESHTQE